MKLKVADQKQWRGHVRFVFNAGNTKVGPRISGLTVPSGVGKCVTATRDAKGNASVIVSLGESTKIKAETFRLAGGAITNWMRDCGVTSAGVDIPEIVGVSATDVIQAVSEGLMLADYAFNRHKSAATKRENLSVDLLVKKQAAGDVQTVARATRICDAVHTARDIAHEPPNVINPVTLAQRATALAKKHGLKCTVLDHRRLATMKAGGILAVGQGSAIPPRLIVLEYSPRGRSGKPVVLVGKAITFDTGGYSIKTKDGILGMKYDKCGGMAVLGAMQAVATLKPKVPVVGVIAAAENMIDGAAYRPDDIITTLSGKTVQIVSADAEGRMVLCDALTYAQQKYKPRAMIDLATLTGGVVVSLGSVAAGIFSNDEALQKSLIDAGQRTHERLWPLPLWDEYLDLLAGDDSDIKNSGNREAHAVQGGIFLKQFVSDDVPWAHLDIAGVADIPKDSAYCPKGATGFGVRLLMEYVATLR
ncbi:MAG: leucyl aminopeptidase [Phycisphaerales bacterium]|nr:leucyl aminopeptidase [Phycisphaerales bacterium]